MNRERKRKIFHTGANNSSGPYKLDLRSNLFKIVNNEQNFGGRVPYFGPYFNCKQNKNNIKI